MVGCQKRKAETRGLPETCQSVHCSIPGAGLWTEEGAWAFEPCLLAAALQTVSHGQGWETEKLREFKAPHGCSRTPYVVMLC